MHGKAVQHQARQQHDVRSTVLPATHTQRARTSRSLSRKRGLVGLSLLSVW
jgi:hypothetical protein